MINIYAGSTSQSIDVFIPDSTSTSGAGKTALAYNTSGLKCYYRKGATGSPTAVTLATLANAQAAYSSGGFVEIDSTNMPGTYRFDIPNAAIDTAGFVHLEFSGATGMAPVLVRINCSAIAVDVKSVAGTAQTARDLGASVLISSGTGAGQLDVTSGRIKSDAVYWNGSAVAAPATAGCPVVTHKVGTGTGEINLSSGKVPATLASTDVTGNLACDLQTIKTLTVTATGNPGIQIQSYIGNANSYLSVGGSGNANVDLQAIKGQAVTCAAPVTVLASVGTASTSTAQTGDAYARLGAPAGASVSADIATVASYVDTEVAAIKAKTDNLPAAPAAVGDIPTAVQVADAILGRNVAGGSNGGRTVSQALYVLRNKVTIAAGTVTVYQTDDTTTSWTGAVTAAAGDPLTGIDPA